MWQIGHVLHNCKVSKSYDYDCRSYQIYDQLCNLKLVCVYSKKLTFMEKNQPNITVFPTGTTSKKVFPILISRANNSVAAEINKSKYKGNKEHIFKK